MRKRTTRTRFGPSIYRKRLLPELRQYRQLPKALRDYYRSWSMEELITALVANGQKHYRGWTNERLKRRYLSGFRVELVNEAASFLLSRDVAPS